MASKDLIKVDDEYFDPYYILQVTRDDSDEMIAKSFKVKVKKYHPDKAPSGKKDNYNRKFKIIMESYDFIRKKRGNDMRTRKKENVNVEKGCHSFETVEDIEDKTERLKDTKDYQKVTEELNASVVRQLSGAFDGEKFNTLFEYAKSVDQEVEEVEQALIHPTSDGFWGYNSGFASNCALVSSFNGLMFTGDNEEGGYWGEEYSDYQKTFKVAKNPSKKVTVPTTFKKTQYVQEKDTFKNYQEAYTDATRDAPKNISIERESLFEKAMRKLEDDQEKERKRVLKYANQYSDQQIVQDAIDGRLETSSQLGLDKHYKVKRITND